MKDSLMITFHEKTIEITKKGIIVILLIQDLLDANLEGLLHKLNTERGRNKYGKTN